MIKYIDEEEEKIIGSLNSDEWVSDFNLDIKKQYEEYARLSLSNSKEIRATISEKDFNKIQIKALQEGLTSESILAMLVHKYNEGKISLTI